MEDADKEKIKQRYELIKMAQELLNDDYANKRAMDHNKWLADNDEEWRTRRRHLPYPLIAQYPTDKEILKTATNLYNFINAGPETEPDDTPPVEPIEQVPVATVTSPLASVEETLPTIVSQDNSVSEEVIPAIVVPDKADELQEIGDKVDPSDVAMSMLRLRLEELRTDEQKKSIKDSGFLPAWIKRTLD